MKSKRTVIKGTPEERLWARAEVQEGEDPCWLWTGALFPGQEYGQITVAGKVLRVHRFAWEVTNGEIPEGMMVCHHCDTPACINPDHLFLGTALDNVTDMISKGRKRVAVGMKLPQTKLTEHDVREIRRLRSEGVRVCDLSRMFGVTHVPIIYLLKGKTHKHVK